MSVRKPIRNENTYDKKFDTNDQRSNTKLDNQNRCGSNPFLPPHYTTNSEIHLKCDLMLDFKDSNKSQYMYIYMFLNQPTKYGYITLLNIRQNCLLYLKISNVLLHYVE